MNRNVFISFLGVGGYNPCSYFTTNIDSGVETCFVQEATIKYHCQNFDAYYFFLTDDARKNNWGNEGGLLQCLQGIKPELKEGTVHDVSIPNGFTIDEMWDIFQIVFDCIKERDTIVFDITHGFRNLPMLGMVLINYLKATKNVEISGIHYGAYENPIFTDKKDTNGEKKKVRNVRLLDFVGFSVLQDWTTAANNLYDFGNVDSLSELINKSIAPVLKETKGQDEEAKKLHKLIKPLPEVFQNIRTVRAKEIYKADKYNLIKEAISSIDKSKAPQLAPLLNRIENKFSEFSNSESTKNGFSAVELCLDYGWIQQAYTLLIETVVSYILETENLDWESTINRNIVNSCFSIAENRIPESDWRGDAAKNRNLTRRLMESEIIRDLQEDMNNLIDSRNDVNHAGVRFNARTSDKIRKQIESIYKSIISKVGNKC